jgi:hypothetical protein
LRNIAGVDNFSHNPKNPGTNWSGWAQKWAQRFPCLFMGGGR